MMTKLTKKLRAALQRFSIGTNAAVVVAVSGGADSTALFDALWRLREQNGAPGSMFAAHLNHQLRGAESDEDEIFVREMAARQSISVIIERLAVAQHAAAEKRNLEATARHLRYDFLQRAAKQQQANIIFTAHTRDDQVETILMRILRGSSSQGVRGIHQETLFPDGVKLVRPMLDVTRAEVLQHCTHHNLVFRTDSSNATTDFTRNRIRHELVPLLQTFNPKADETLIRFAGLLTEDDFCLEQMANEWLLKTCGDSTLEIQPLASLHSALRRRVLRLWLKTERNGLQRIEAVHLIALERLMLKSDGGRMVELPGGWQVEKRRGQLQLRHPPT